MSLLSLFLSALGLIFLLNWPYYQGLQILPIFTIHGQTYIKAYDINKISSISNRIHLLPNKSFKTIDQLRKSWNCKVHNTYISRRLACCFSILTVNPQSEQKKSNFCWLSIDTSLPTPFLLSKAEASCSFPPPPPPKPAKIALWAEL